MLVSAGKMSLLQGTSQCQYNEGKVLCVLRVWFSKSGKERLLAGRCQGSK